jgi:hypothetical protein
LIWRSACAPPASWKRRIAAPAARAPRTSSAERIRGQPRDPVARAFHVLGAHDRRPERTARAARGDQHRPRHRRARGAQPRGRAQLVDRARDPEDRAAPERSEQPPWRTGRRWIRSARPGSARIAVAARPLPAAPPANARSTASGCGQPSEASGSANAASTRQ